ncbi:hypothetical protein ACVRZD_05460 [Streptococcus hongkongensis]
MSDRQLLCDLLDRVQDRFLETIDSESLEEIIDRSWNSPVSRAVRLVSSIDDALMHSGQAVYTRRLVIGK